MGSADRRSALQAHGAIALPLTAHLEVQCRQLGFHGAFLPLAGKVQRQGLHRRRPSRIRQVSCVEFKAEVALCE